MCALLAVDSLRGGLAEGNRILGGIIFSGPLPKAALGQGEGGWRGLRGRKPLGNIFGSKNDELTLIKHGDAVRAPAVQWPIGGAARSHCVLVHPCAAGAQRYVWTRAVAWKVASALAATHEDAVCGVSTKRTASFTGGVQNAFPNQQENEMLQTQGCLCVTTGAVACGVASGNESPEWSALGWVGFQRDTAL